MIIYPAIDIKGGKCVRLIKGDMNKETQYGNPVDVAKRWQNEGARYIHVVDLDAAIEGNFSNRDTVKEILNNVNIPIQLGGGIRTLEDIDERLTLGINRVIIGTAAYKNPALVKEASIRYPGKIVVGIDANEGGIAVSAWTEKTNVSPVEFALKMKDIGIDTVIFTDISKDGMLSGPNVEWTKTMVEKTGLNIIASGGISSLTDIKAVKEAGVSGVIVGKALYNGNFSLNEAVYYAD